MLSNQYYRFSDFNKDKLSTNDLELINEIKKENWNFFLFYDDPIIEWIGLGKINENKYIIRLSPFLYLDKSRIPNLNFKYFNQSEKYKTQLLDSYISMKRLYPLIIEILNDFSLFISYSIDTKINISSLKKMDMFLSNNFWRILSPQEIAVILTSLDGELCGQWAQTRVNFGSDLCINASGDTYRRGTLDDIHVQSNPQRLALQKYNVWFLRYMAQRFTFDEDIRYAFDDEHPFKKIGPVTCLEEKNSIVYKGGI